MNLYDFASPAVQPWGYTVAWMGWHYGANALEVEKTRVRTGLFERLKVDPNSTLVLLLHEHNEDGPGSHSFNREKTLDELAQEAQNRISGNKSLQRLTTFEAFKEFVEYEHDHDWGGCHGVLTRDEFDVYQREERRKRVEEYASEVASAHNVRVGTPEFIKALREEIDEVGDCRERWNNPERRMEEWAAHRYAGNSYETYFDDLNFENGRFESRLDALREVWDWLEQYCPLLMARMMEESLQETSDADQFSE
jgi:hypothetical protein